MKDFSKQAFLMFHDAFQYFENEYNLNQAYFVTSTPEHKIGIRQIQNLRYKIKQQKISCVFYEPPQTPKILHTIIDGNDLTVRPLEPLGSHIEAGENLYFELLTNISNQLYNCLVATHEQ